MSKIKAVLFDLDGTLRNSVEMVYVVFETALAEYLDRLPSREEMYDHLSHHTVMHQKFVNHVPLAEFESSFARLYDDQKSRMKLYDGAAEILRKLHKEGMRLGLVTSDHAPSEYLKQQALHTVFEVVIDGSSVKNVKPHPEPIEKALQQLKLLPNETVMVGDMAADVQSAKEAGLENIIGVTHGLGKKDTLQAAGASHIIDSLAELPAVLASIEKS